MRAARPPALTCPPLRLRRSLPLAVVGFWLVGMLVGFGCGKVYAAVSARGFASVGGAPAAAEGDGSVEADDSQTPLNQLR